MHQPETRFAAQCSVKFSGAFKLGPLIFLIGLFIQTLIGFQSVAVAAPGDFNNDGTSDLIFADSVGRVTVRLMDGVAGAPAEELLPAASGWSVIFAGDFDGDDNNDLVLRYRDGSIFLYLMDGHRASAGRLLLGPTLDWSVTHVADLNGDGKSDIVFKHANGSVFIYLMDGLTFQSGGYLLGSNTGWSVTHAADLDGDGKSDFVLRHVDGSVYAYLMNGTVVKSGRLLLGPGADWRVAHVTDLNGDGNADLLIQHTNGSVFAYLMNGLSFAGGAYLLGSGTGWNVVAFADLDGDGKSDLVLRKTDGSVFAYLMDGLSVRAGKLLLGPNNGWSIGPLLDLNGDGRSDFLFANADGSVFAYLMDGLTFLKGEFVQAAGASQSLFSMPTTSPAPVSRTADAIAKGNAARFLAQATFGPNAAEINNLVAIGLDAWFTQQFAMPAPSHLQYIDAAKARRLAASTDGKADFADSDSYEAIWQQWLWSGDQLRARMSFALSEIMVVSNVAPDLYPEAMSSYMDTLNRHAFGTYRDLLEAVTLQPAMGYYLNMMGSEKEDVAANKRPNENYAREVLQLFSIGLYQLNADGSRKLDTGGRPIPTYDEEVVQGFAQAFTGWSFAGNDTNNPDIFDHPPVENWRQPMQAWASKHSPGTKKLLNGVVLPAGQSPVADLRAALDNIASHPNVGPFIGRQLIQRFVTSNPSPAYIARITAVFNNNGQGVRGDLAAVLKAILTDSEARGVLSGATWGKQREPVIRFANMLRAFDGRSQNGLNSIHYLDSPDDALGQSPLLAPSVFNFFSPNYTRPGKLAQAGIVAPEFQITNEIQTIGTANFFYNLVQNEGYGYDASKVAMDLSQAKSLASDPRKLVDFLDGRMTYARLSTATRLSIVESVSAVQYDGSDWCRSLRVRTALTLMALSPDFVIQK